MTPAFSVRTTARFERLARSFSKRHPEFRGLLERAVQALTADPHNRSRAHHIKKLEAIPLGEGQWRRSLGRFQSRYDVYGREVVLQYCGLRREDTYR